MEDYTMEENIDLSKVIHVDTPKSGFIIQPVSFSMAKYDFDVSKIKMMVSIFSQMQELIKQGYKKPIDTLPLFADMIYGNKITVRVDLKDIVSSPKRYEEVINVLRDIGSLQVDYPIKDLINGTEFVKYTNFCDVIVPKTSRRSYVIVTMDRSVAKLFLDASTFGYQKYLKEVIMTSKSKYTQRIFLLLTAFKNKQSVVFSLDFLKSTMKIEDKYPRWPKFCDNVIIAAENELKDKFEQGVSECCFTYEPIYKAGKHAGWPVAIKFNIILSDDEKRHMEQNSIVSIRILCQDKLGQLGIRQKDIRKFMEKLKDANVHEFDEYLSELNDKVQRDGKAINDIPAYAQEACKNFFKIMKQRSMRLMKAEITTFETNLMDMYADEWNATLSVLLDTLSPDVVDVWIKPLSLQKVEEVENGKISIHLLSPSRFLLETIEERYAKQLKSALEKCFKHKVVLYYCVK